MAHDGRIIIDQRLAHLHPCMHVIVRIQFHHHILTVIWLLVCETRSRRLVKIPQHKATTIFKALIALVNVVRSPSHRFRQLIYALCRETSWLLRSMMLWNMQLWGVRCVDQRDTGGKHGRFHRRWFHQCHHILIVTKRWNLLPINGENIVVIVIFPSCFAAFIVFLFLHVLLRLLMIFMKYRANCSIILRLMLLISSTTKSLLLPLAEDEIALKSGRFRDLMFLCYGWISLMFRCLSNGWRQNYYLPSRHAC